MNVAILLCLVVIVCAAPQKNYRDAKILRYAYENPGFGGYKYDFEQSDGTKAEQFGVVNNEGKEDEFLSVQGSYSYVGDDDVTYTVNYNADQNGYRPDIDQGPGGGVPPAVVASLLG